MGNARLDEAQARIRIAGRNINNLTYADDTIFMAESKEELKSLLRKVKEESEKSWLKAQHSKKLNKDYGMWSHHFMANRWETMETVIDFIFLSSQITADGDCSHKIKRCLLLGRKAMIKLDSILKCRDIFADKGLSSQGYGFSSGHVWMSELDCEESWVLKNWCF